MKEPIEIDALIVGFVLGAYIFGFAAMAYQLLQSACS
jgi:hypothetical protein